MSDGYEFDAGIERLHLEQDAGKLIHDLHADKSLVDLNRSGVALMEIVSRPDLRSAEETKAYINKMRTLLRYIDSCDGDMEKGSLRADINISVRRPGDELGTRCEIKNVNSIRFAGQAVDYEAKRQISMIENGDKVKQQTRLFDPKSGKTRAMRAKEEAHDYRYFPDPDLLPIVIEQAYVDNLARELPELPDVKYQRFCNELNIDRASAVILASDRKAAEYFENLVTSHNPQLAANWVVNELFAYLNKHNLSIDASPVSWQQLGQIIDLIGQNKISGKIAKELFDIVWQDGGDPGKIVHDRNMLQVSDLGAIEKIVEEIIAANPDQVTAVKNKPKVMGWFVGQVMKQTKGKANPQSVNEILNRKLGL